MLNLDPPKITYSNNPTFSAAYDPTENESDISNITYPNFQINNTIWWVNISSRNYFILRDIENPIYDPSGNLIGGDYVWAQINLTNVSITK